MISEKTERFFFTHTYGSRRRQRVYLKLGLKPVQFFEELNKRKVDYILLRSWEDWPSFPEDEDINILVEDEHRDRINDLISPYDVRGIKCDVYTATGSNGGSRFDVPLFPYNLTRQLFKEKMEYKGVIIPGPITYFASVAYHAVLHKGSESGIPGFDSTSEVIRYDYTRVLKKLSGELNLGVEITARELFDWLKKEGFAPAEDTLTKLIENREELNMFATPLYGDIRGGELTVYVIRKRFFEDGYLDLFLKMLQRDYRFDILDVRMLTPAEKEHCMHQLRGGKWDKGPYRISGGPPVAVIVAFDHQPWPLSDRDQEKQTRMTNQNNLKAKLEIRRKLTSILKEKFYNGVHSADNENDAWTYLTEVGEGYREKIYSQTEKIREDRSKKKLQDIDQSVYVDHQTLGSTTLTDSSMNFSGNG